MFPGLGFMMKRTFYEQNMKNKMAECCSAKSVPIIQSSASPPLLFFYLTHSKHERRTDDKTASASDEEELKG